MDIAFFSIVQWYCLIGILGIIIGFADSSKKVIYVGSRRICTCQAFGLGICCLIMSGLAAYRTNIGDTPNYTNIFRNTPIFWTDFKNFVTDRSEKGFYFLNYIIKKYIGDSSHIYLFITSFVIILGVIVFFYKYTEAAGMCLLIYILSGSYVSGMNGIRQSIVAATFAISVIFIREKKIIYYMLLCLILYTIHNSAIILIPMYWILNMKAWKKGSYILVGITGILYVVYPVFASILVNLLQGSTYEVYGNGIQNFTNGGANIIRLLVLGLPIVLSFMFRKKIEKECKYFGMLLNGALMNFMFMLLATIRSWIFARFCMYFNVFSIALLVVCIKASEKNKKMLYVLCICFYLVFFYYEMRATIGF